MRAQDSVSFCPCPHPVPPRDNGSVVEDNRAVLGQKWVQSGIHSEDGSFENSLSLSQESQQSPEGPSPATLRAWKGRANVYESLLHYGILEELQYCVYVKCKNKTAIFGQFTLLAPQARKS